MPKESSADSASSAPHQQAAANLYALIESTEDLIWSIDLNYRIVTFNSAMRRYVGRNFGTRIAIAKRLEDFLPPERVAIWMPLLERALSIGPYRAEIPFPGRRVVEVSFNLVVVDGKVAGLSMFGKDVTARNGVEKELRETAEFLQETQRIGVLGSYLLDIPSDRWTSSDVLDELFGIDNEFDRTTAAWVELVHPDDRAMMAEYFATEVVGKGKEFDKEYRIVRVRDQAERWMHGMGSLEFDAHGQPLKMRGVIKDITARKLAEQAILDSQKFTQATIDALSTTICVLDETGAIIAVNRTWREFAQANRIAHGDGNASAPHAFPLPMFPLFDEGANYLEACDAATGPEAADAVAFATGIRTVLRGESEQFSMEYPHHSATEKCWFAGRVTRFQASGPLRVVIEHIDITAMKQSEALLRETADRLSLSEERYRCTFEQAPVGIVHTSADGIFLRCNARFAEIVGYRQDEITGMSAQQITAPEDMAETLAKLFQVSTASNSFCWEKRYVRKNGSLVWVRITASAQRDDQGNLVHHIALVEDIDSLKSAERRLASVQEALKASEAHYRTVFQTSLDGICLSRLSDGRYIDVNKAFLDLMALEWDEMVGNTSLELNFWVDPGTREKMIAALRRGSSFRDWETQFVRKDGKQIWLQISASLIEIGELQCILSVMHDISVAKAGEQLLLAAQEELRLSEERYRTAFQTSIDAININRLADGTYLDCNKAFLDLTGYTREEVIGRTSLQLNIWADREDRAKMVAALLQQGGCQDLESRFRTKNGEIRWGLMSVSPIAIDEVACTLSVTRDITEAKASEQRLATAAESVRRSEERYRKVFQTSLDPITITRIDTKQYLDVNDAFLKAMGFVRDEVIGKLPSDLGIWTHPDDLQSLATILATIGECRDLEVEFTRKTGETVWGLMSASLIEIDGIPCALTITRDISRAKAAEDEIRNLAFYDTLTGLPNRRLLLERLHQAMASSRRAGRMCALLFVDLDNFKTLNDTLGHQTGDLLLQVAATRLTACVRETDTVGRLGGDEFVLMLTDLSDIPEDAAAQAKAVGEKILSHIAQPYLLQGRECRSSACIGISVFGDKQVSASEVLQQADIAMYQAKTAGRNTLRFFAPALQAAVNARAAMEEDLRQAIQTSQFVLYYQPQIDRNRLTGAEALLRWNHPRRNILAPGEFISLAEESGLILPLGKWVLEAASAQIAAWSNYPPSARLSIAVNISARQFREPEFVEQVLQALARAGANPKNLKLELTESMLVENIDEVIDKMTELKSHGLRFSLDDFGTGYSSLAYLKRLPLDQLKIDRSFIRDILKDESSAAIAQTIISLSRAMGLPVIAEGVETDEQRELLARLGCHAFQGYLFGRPLPLEDFEKQWLPGARAAFSAAS
jgi:diguanylate cyclase (GGDEF)-like protein/PAS domain S-box-containing protein